MAGKAKGGEARSHVSKLTVKASTTIVRKIFVAVDGGLPGAGARVAGVSLFSGVAGESIEVVDQGIAVVTAHETLNNGDPVTPHTDGTAKAATGSDVIAGKVVYGGGGDAGDDVQIMLSGN
jgi:hypothetical protein